MSRIRINQMGYQPESMKELVYIGEEMEFSICHCEDQRIVYTGRLNKLRYDEASGDAVCVGDFTNVSQPGNYYVRIGNEVSLNFTISAKQAEICMDALLKGFYYQRCGIELTKEYAGPWHHQACHLHPSYVFCQDAKELLAADPGKLEQIDTSGGWHDAGDYGRYSVACVKTIADLLMAYEFFGEAFHHSSNIPESILEGDDILHEVKVGLDFLFKMQKDSDGSVYTKVASRYFPGMIMPDKDKEPLLIFDTSSPATAGFAAVMAMATEAYQELNQQYSKKCLTAAEKAYKWLKNHPEPKLFKNPPDVVSGEYGDISDLDERYFAAAMMYRVTGDKAYHEDFISLYNRLEDKISLGWRRVGGYGTIAYLFSGRPLNEDISRALKMDWLQEADRLKARSEEDSYGVTLSLDQYLWGSNMILLNQSIHLIIAERLLGRSDYEPVIQHSWDYILGRNPMDISYVTGLGEFSVQNPHHRPSASDGVEAPIPGLLSGGPSSGLQDEAARKLCQGNPPAKCFLDLSESYSTNEIDIYWNSPAVFVGAYLNKS